MDPVCCESTSWMEIAQVHKLSKGANQPFYQVNPNLNPPQSLRPQFIKVYNQSQIIFFLSSNDMDLPICYLTIDMQVLVNVHTNPDILVAYGTKISFFINPILKKLCMMFL